MGPKVRDETADSTAVASAQPLPDRAGAIREAAVLEEPKHRGLITSPKHGQILSGLMRPGYTFGSVPSGHALLTTTGPKTGKPRRKVIRAILQGDSVYIVQLRPPALAAETPLAVAAWVLNIRAEPHVQLKLSRCTFAATMREIEEPVELARAREIFCEPVQLVDYPECVIHLKGRPSARKIRDLHRYWFDTGVPLVATLQSQTTD